MILGCIADDFTGATDLANTLVRAGMRVIQTTGVPDNPPDGQADAVVVALKSRTIPAVQAVRQSLEALEWLQRQGAKQIYFKYCSTFDSTPEGNIGPVLEALLKALSCDFTISTPAFPDNGRTVFKGHLFVGDLLLSDSGMRQHPLTPMTNSNLVQVLQAQCDVRVGLIDYQSVARGPQSIGERIAVLRSQGIGAAIVDACSNDDLLSLGVALKDMPLVTGSSGVAIGLPKNFGINPSSAASELPPARGWRAIVSGSCSSATNSQVADFIARGGAAFAVDPMQLADGSDVVGQALAWTDTQLPVGPVLVYATAQPEALRAVQLQLGVSQAGEITEHALASIARGLAERGVGQLLVAGGETSGACIHSLGISSLRVGPQIAPGVPWCYGASPHATSGCLHIALKSGNFGAVDFFTHAFTLLERHGECKDVGVSHGLYGT